jgi:hypothetical protein
MPDPKKKMYIKDTDTTIDSDSNVAAKKNEGVFQEMPAFKGQLLTTRAGGKSFAYGYKTHSGEFKRASNDTEAESLKKAYEKEKALYNKMKQGKSERINRFQKATSYKNK